MDFNFVGCAGCWPVGPPLPHTSFSANAYVHFPRFLCQLVAWWVWPVGGPGVRKGGKAPLIWLLVAFPLWLPPTGGSHCGPSCHWMTLLLGSGNTEPSSPPSGLGVVEDSCCYQSLGYFSLLCWLLSISKVCETDSLLSVFQIEPWQIEFSYCSVLIW